MIIHPKCDYFYRLGFNFGPTRKIETGGDVYFAVDIRPDALTLNRRINEEWEIGVNYNATKLFTADQMFTMEITHAERITRVTINTELNGLRKYLFEKN